MDYKKVAVVTGANKLQGIGLAVVRGLAQQGLQVVLTSRDPAKGDAAVALLKSEGLDVLTQPLDVSDLASVNQLKSFLESKFDRLDVLVNNAALWLDNLDGTTGSIFETQVSTLEATLAANLMGPLLVSQKLIPLMKRHNYGRVVNVSSGAGQLSDMASGYPSYRMSKTALNALTRIFAHELKDTNILVNAVCPGWVRTAMGGPNAPRSPEEGADTIVWLATLADGAPTGGFFRNRQPLAW